MSLFLIFQWARTLVLVIIGFFAFAALIICIVSCSVTIYGTCDCCYQCCSCCRKTPTDLPYTVSFFQWIFHIQTFLTDLLDLIWRGPTVDTAWIRWGYNASTSTMANAQYSSGHGCLSPSNCQLQMALLIKIILWFRMDVSLSATENNYANETSAINKILFITFSANQAT